MAWALGLAVAGLAGCRVEVGARKESRGETNAGSTVHVYTSMYKEVIDAVGPVLERRMATSAPGTKLEWFQSGSEKVATRLDAELAAGGSPCDLLLTSDPAYYERLKSEGRLVPYVSPLALRQPREFIDVDGAFATARVSVMVIGLSRDAASRPDAPRSFAELTTSPAKVTMGDPLSSGTYFSTVSDLSARLGWPWFRALKEKKTVASGGNSSVLQRLETTEADAGIVLLENLLAARARGSKVTVVIPSDGAVVVPGPIALMTHARHSEAARAVYDALLSNEVQEVIVNAGRMHSPDPNRPPPDGAPPLGELLAKGAKPKPESAEVVKATFDRIFFR